MIWESNLVIFPSLLSVAMVILNWNLVSADFFFPLFPPSKFYKSCAVYSQAKILIIHFFLFFIWLIWGEAEIKQL